MDCYAWRIPEGCYQSLQPRESSTPMWFWAATAAVVLLSMRKKGNGRKVRARRR